MSNSSKLTLPRALWAAAAFGVAIHAGHTLFDLAGDEPTPLFATWLPLGVMLLAAASCVTRSALVREERAAWMVIGVGLALYSVGTPYYNVILADNPPTHFPSGPDLFWLTLAPAGALAAALLVRAQARRVRFGLWLDGLIGGLALAALGATVLFRVVLVGPLAAPTGNLTFTLNDQLMVGFAVASWSVLGWRPSRGLLLLTIGFVGIALVDGLYLREMVLGTYRPGESLDSWWLMTVLVIAAGASLHPRRAEAPAAARSPVVAIPFVFALSAVGLALYFGLSTQISPVAALLNAATLIAVVARFALTARSQLAMLAASRREARTDSLTGLGNRRRLVDDLETTIATASPQRPAVLALFDLDGFKDCNDRYGHPAGDALLSRLGARLSACLFDGRAYRMGGDEFCVLAPAGAGEREAVVAAAAGALSEQGEGFQIGCSYGFVSLPTEVGSASEALRLADRRMYERKYSARTSPARQSTDVLLGLMAERDEWLGTHMEDTTRLCEAVGRELRLPVDELAPLVQAAALHDIGKAAIPDAILNKPGPLTDEEWKFMRRHVVIGERILQGAPSLARAARLVRCSHERYDGAGYPDGLAGDDIPLAARVIGACDAYDAMTSDRPYRRAMSPEVALAELRANAGTQFDPVVIEVLCRVLTRAGSPAPPRRRAAALRPNRSSS